MCLEFQSTIIDLGHLETIGIPINLQNFVLMTHLFVGNFPFNIDNQQLGELFEGTIKVLDVILSLKKEELENHMDLVL
jgi:hypothetical protein